MPSLFESQSFVRDVVVAGSTRGSGPPLIGGRDPSRRLAIHRRHYHASLAAALRQRFPATVWLIGDAQFNLAASTFVADHPPKVVCIAEYGEGFPGYLAARPDAGTVPYLSSFARLEWQVGSVSVAVSGQAVDPDWLQQQDPDTLGGRGLVLQPGLCYIHALWPVDALLRAYLAGDVPDTMTIAEGDRWIEVRGARGEVNLNGLSSAAWHFRRALSGGVFIEDAAGAALDVNPDFDPGSALVHLIAEGLVTGLRSSHP